jgi:hypothetical protein
MQRKIGVGNKALAQQKSALKPEGSFLKVKVKQAITPKKQGSFETGIGSESD